jgi:hypothetical protein
MTSCTEVTSCLPRPLLVCKTLPPATPTLFLWVFVGKNGVDMCVEVLVGTVVWVPMPMARDMGMGVWPSESETGHWEYVERTKHKTLHTHGAVKPRQNRGGAPILFVTSRPPYTFSTRPA